MNKERKHPIEEDLYVRCPQCKKAFDAHADSGNFWWGGIGDEENLQCPHCGTRTDTEDGWDYEEFREVRWGSGLWNTPLDT